MKFCIYGAGAVGGLIAGWLARSGESVSVVARGAQLDAIRSQGLRIRDRESGRIDALPVKAESDPAALGPQDYVVVAVKGQSLTGVAEKISPLLSSGASVVTAMNGVPWWFFDRLKNGKGPLESLDAGGKIAKAIP